MLSTVLGTLFQQTGSENAEALAKIVPLPVRRDSLTLLTVTHRLAKQNRPEVARPIASLGQGSVGENPDLWSASLAQSLKGKNPLAINSLLAQAKKNLPPISFSRAVAPLRSNLLSLNGLTDWQGEKAERAQLQQQEYRFVLRQGDLERANRLLDLASKDSELGVENRSWVERERLQLLARIGEEANRLELTPLTVIASTEEKRHRVTLLATLLQSASGARRTELLRDGIALLESITRDSSATDRDWFRLGQFYRLTNDRPGYRKTLDELTRREPENLFYLAAKVDELLVDGNLTEAQSEMPKLRKGVHDFRVLSTVCRFACLNQQPEEVHAAVDRYLAAAEVGTGDDQLRIRRTAELYDQLQRIAMGRGYASASAYLTAAMEKYRLAVRNDLESLPPFVEMLARTQQVPAAMELLQSLKPRLNGRVLMTSGMTVLRTGHATPRQYQQVRDWIDEQEKQPSQAKLATMHRADWFALQGKFPEAEAVYRKVLEADASNVVALNNLAWILAASPNRADEALKFIDTAIEKLGPSGELLDTKARILISKGSYAMAEQNLQEALGESKTSLRYFHLALSKLKQSRKDEALQAFREARSRGLEVKQIHPDDLTTFKVLTSQTDR
jgi:tetratricopeptide (TPR) repeat protein